MPPTRAVCLVVASLLTACGGADGAGSDTSNAADTSAPADASDVDISEDDGATTESTTPDADAAGDSTAPDADVATDTVEDAATVDTATPAAAWPALPGSSPCPLDAGAPLLDAALEAVGLDHDSLGWTDADLRRSTGYYLGGVLDDAFLLPWQRATLWSGARAGCTASAIAERLDTALTSPHPISTAIRLAAELLAREGDGGPTPDVAASTLAEALSLACAAAGRQCAPDTSAVAPELAEALLPVVLAIADGLAARRIMVADAPPLPGTTWVASGGIGTMAFASYPALVDQAVRDHLLGATTRPALNLAAARIAWAIETVDWSRLRDRADIDAVAIPTPIGWLRVGGASADTYPADLGETFLLVDLGGDDHYENEVGANTASSFGVNVALDLAGADDYGYVETPTPQDDPALLPADPAGRYVGDASYGPLSLSRAARQGAGRHGVGMLFDLGRGNDHYRSLTMSQGYAHLGVGVLYDDGGDDIYESEQASQGAAGYGIGLLVDAGGDDRYRVATNGQGAGAPAGAGLLWDGAGDDDYRCDPGTEESETLPLFFSPQMPGTANNSSSQGAGTGIRWDEQGVFLSGGLGVLRDVAGDDHYRCGVFCEGSGFWQGVGLLADGAGADTYDGLYYADGGAAHYAIGVVLDAGPGDDAVGMTFTPRYVQVGAGHDFSLGLFWNEAGDDQYRVGGLSLGAGNCNGIGLFVDEDGADAYAIGPSSTGYASLGECAGDATRPLAPTVGLFVDAGGADDYGVVADPPDATTPSDGRAWRRSQGGVATELGVGLDGDGASGLLGLGRVSPPPARR